MDSGTGVQNPRYSWLGKSENVFSFGITWCWVRPKHKVKLKIGISWHWVILQILLRHSAGNSVMVESGNWRQEHKVKIGIGISWHWVMLQILLRHSAGNSVKVGSKIVRPEQMKSENVILIRIALYWDFRFCYAIWLVIAWWSGAGKRGQNPR